MENLHFLKNYKFNSEGRLLKGEKKRMTPQEKLLYERAYANLYYEKNRRKSDLPIKKYKVKNKISLMPQIEI